MLIDGDWPEKRLHELLDQPQVQNYDGSWVEYGSLIGVPIER